MAPVAAASQGAQEAASRKRLGILALQGAFEEHQASFARMPEALKAQIEVVQVRTCEELERCDAVVIPGGESTTMKIIAGADSFMDVLRAYVHGGKGSDGVERPARPVWGTCAGCILLSDTVINGYAGGGGLSGVSGLESDTKRCKYGEQVGGLAISTCRNFFGRQTESFEAPTVGDGELMAKKDVANDDVAKEAARKAFEEFPAVFIRAPAILKVGDGVRVLARVHHPSQKHDEDGGRGSIVAAASERVMVTCFHPELVTDFRIHQYFVEHFVLRGASKAPTLPAAAVAAPVAEAGSAESP